MVAMPTNYITRGAKQTRKQMFMFYLSASFESWSIICSKFYTVKNVIHMSTLLLDKPLTTSKSSHKISA